MATPSAIPIPNEIAEFKALITKPIAEIVKDPQLASRLRLDIAVSAKPIQMSVEECTFTVSLSPGILQMVQPPYTVNVTVLLMDVFGNMASVNVPLKSTGQTITQAVNVPIADRAVLGFPDPGRIMFVIVDPLNSIVERNEGNNWAKTYCYTVG